jgi:hypothetical protein
MARKSLDITIPKDSGSRDASKLFRLTEMPASQAEKWAARAFLAMARNGIEIPDDIASSGLAGIAAIGLKAIGGMRYEDAEPLLDEMFLCVAIIPDPNKPAVIRGLMEEDIEEISTRLMLRKELFNLHVGFFTRAVA